MHQTTYAKISIKSKSKPICFLVRFDSLTGVHIAQKSIATEKASVLFNIGALYTRQDKTTENGLDCAVNNFLRAAGTFMFIHENFNNAPSIDLGSGCLNMLVQLMLGQAR